MVKIQKVQKEDTNNIDLNIDNNDDEKLEKICNFFNIDRAIPQVDEINSKEDCGVYFEKMRHSYVVLSEAQLLLDKCRRDVINSLATMQELYKKLDNNENSNLIKNNPNKLSKTTLEEYHDDEHNNDDDCSDDNDNENMDDDNGNINNINININNDDTNNEDIIDDVIEEVVCKQPKKKSTKKTTEDEPVVEDKQVKNSNKKNSNQK